MLHVTAVRPLGGTRLWLRFDDGQEGEIELAPELEGAVFVPLRDPAVFAQVAIDPDTRTIAWPNGADFAPEFLASLLAQRTAA
jgi:hypothetical protein